MPIVAVPILTFSNLDLLLARFPHVLGHKIPLVHHHDAGASLLDNHVGNLFVLFGNSAHRVNHQHGDIASSNGALGSFNRKIFDAVVDASCLSNTGGVHQYVLFTTGLGHHLERNVDRIAGSPRDFADDNPIRSGHPVNDGRLADIRAANDGQALRTVSPATRQSFALFSFFKRHGSPIRIDLIGFSRF